MVDGTWIARLASTDLAERARLLEELVAERFREALLIPPAEPVPLDESYFALGLTSLSAVEIEQDLRAALGRPISTTEILNNPTVGHLLAYLRAEVLADLFAGAREPSGSRVPPAEAAAALPAGRRAILDGLLRDLYRA